MLLALSQFFRMSIFGNIHSCHALVKAVQLKYRFFANVNLGDLGVSGSLDLLNIDLLVNTDHKSHFASSKMGAE